MTYRWHLAHAVFAQRPLATRRSLPPAPLHPPPPIALPASATDSAAHAQTKPTLFFARPKIPRRCPSLNLLGTLSGWHSMLLRSVPRVYCLLGSWTTRPWMLIGGSCVGLRNWVWRNDSNTASNRRHHALLSRDSALISCHVVRGGQSEPDRAAWKKAYQLYIEAFKEPKTPLEKKKLARIVKKPLNAEIDNELFEYDPGFLRGLGRMSLSDCLYLSIVFHTDDALSSKSSK